MDLVGGVHPWSDRTPQRTVSRSTYLASTSTSRFTPSPGSSPASVVSRSVCGTSAISTPSPVDRGDREGDAVDGERSLLDAVAQELRRDVERQPAAVALGLDRANAPDAVDVTLDVVAAERLAGAERGLEVDLGPLAEVSESRARERFRDGLEHELAVVARRPRSGSSRRPTPSRRGRSRRPSSAPRSAVVARSAAPFRSAETTRPRSRTIPVNMGLRLPRSASVRPRVACHALGTDP